MDTGPCFKGLAEHCLAVLEGRAMCQEGDDDEDAAAAAAAAGGAGGGGEEPEEEDEEAELGQIVLEGCAELLPALATVAGAAFAPAFQPHFAALMRRTAANRPEGQRSVAYATLVEVVRAVGPAAAPVVPVALPGCIRELAAESPGLRRNCAYCAGVMVEVGGASAAPFHGALAQGLARLLSSEESDRGVKDNAASSAARLLTVGGCSAVKDPAVGPQLVSLLLGALPLVEDFEEAGTAYGGVCTLLKSGEPSLNAHVPRMLQLIGQVAAEEGAKSAKEAAAGGGGKKIKDGEASNRVPEEVLGAMCRTAADLSQQFPAQIGPILSSLPAEQQAAIKANVT